MKAALLSKAALCVCPPALIATSVATVPQVRRAVHHVTRPHVAKHQPVRKRTAAATPGNARRPCPPAVAALTEPNRLATFAQPLPAEPVSTPMAPLSEVATRSTGGTPDNGSFAPIISGLAPVTGGGAPGTPGTPTTPTTPTTPSTPGPPVTPVPEPATWTTMILGFGLLGALMRRRQAEREERRRQRRRRRRSHAPALAGAAAMADALTPLEAAGGGTAAAASAGKATLLAKAALCVCPPALMAATAITVPPVRNAVYHATAPAVRPIVSAMQPCDPALPVASVQPVSSVTKLAPSDAD